MGRKSVTTKTVVTKVTVNSKETPRKRYEYKYVEDEWEKTPKTGYTYAKSGSYSKNYLNKGYVSPNMARRRLHHDHSSSVVNHGVEETREEHASASYHNESSSQQEQSQRMDAMITTAAHGASMLSSTTGGVGMSGSANINVQHQSDTTTSKQTLTVEEEEELERVRNVRGVLRSGTRYGPRWRTVGGHHDHHSSSMHGEDHSMQYTSHMSASEMSQSQVTSQEAHERYASEVEERVLNSPLYGTDFDQQDHVDSRFSRFAHHQSEVSDSETEETSSSRYNATHAYAETNTWSMITKFMSSLVSSSSGLLLWIMSSLFSGVQSAAAYTANRSKGFGSQLYTYVVDHVQNESWLLLKTTSLLDSSINNTRISEEERRRKRRSLCCCLPIPCCLLFLLPLLLLGPYALHERERQDNSTTILAGLPLFGFFSSRDSVEKDRGTSGSSGFFHSSTVDSGASVHHRESTGTQGAQMAGMYIDDKDLEERIRAIVMSIYREGEKTTEDKHQEIHQNILIQQQENLNQYKVDLEQMVRNMLMNEMDTFGAKISDTEKAVLAAAKIEAAAAAKSEALLAVAQSVDDIQAQVSAGETVNVGEEERKAALAGFATRVDGVEMKLTELNTDQSSQQARIADLNNQLLVAVAKTDAVNQELQQAKADMAAGDAAVKDHNALLIEQLQAQLKGLNDELSGLKAAHADLAMTTKSCCKNDSDLIALIKAQVKDHVNAMLLGGAAGGGDGGEDDSGGATMGLGGIFGTSSSDSTAEQGAGGGAGFAAWLQDQLSSKDSVLDAKIAALAADMDAKMAGLKDETGSTVAAALAASSEKEGNCTVCNTTQTVIVQQPACNDSGAAAAAGAFAGGAGVDGLSKEQVESLIHAALLVYGQDKTGKVDYALESGGGSIVSTRCSETYHRKTAQLSLFGIPLWYVSNSPRTVIQPDINIGQCWAFKGSMGYLVIQLAGTITPSSFTLEHITKQMSPTGRIDSAPRDFTVLGLQHEKDREPVSLGNFTYNEGGEGLQNFPVQADKPVGSFPFIELRILNNWGNIEYTCLYRFRVHGQLANWHN